MSDLIRKVLRVHDGSEFEAGDFPTLSEAQGATAQYDALLGALDEIAAASTHHPPIPDGFVGDWRDLRQIARDALSASRVQNGHSRQA